MLPMLHHRNLMWSLPIGQKHVCFFSFLTYMLHLNTLKHTWPPSIYQSQDLFQWWTRWCQLLSTGPVMPLQYHGVSQAVSLVTRVGVGYEAWLQGPNIHEPHKTQCIENLKITSIDKFRCQQSIKTSVWIKNQGTKITASARNRKATPTLGMGDLGKRPVFKTYQRGWKWWNAHPQWSQATPTLETTLQQLEQPKIPIAEESVKMERGVVDLCIHA